MNFRKFMESTESEFVNSLDWSHGSESQFSSFDDNKIGSRTDPGFFGAGHYFVEKKTGIANKWGKQVYDVKVQVQNPLVVTGITDWSKKVNYISTEEIRKANPKISEKDAYKESIRLATENMKRMGYDSVLIKKSDGTHQLVVFNSRNITIV